MYKSTDPFLSNEHTHPPNAEMFANWQVSRHQCWPITNPQHYHVEWGEKVTCSPYLDVPPLAGSEGKMSLCNWEEQQMHEPIASPAWAKHSFIVNLSNDPTPKIHLFEYDADQQAHVA